MANPPLLFSDIQKLHQAGHLKEAKQAYLDFLSFNPQHAIAYNNLGTIFFAEKNWDEAIQAYYHAIEIQPDYAEAYYNLGLALKKSNRLDEAIHTYQALLDLIPEHHAARFQLGLLHMQQHLYQLAVKQFNQLALDYPSHVETQINLATCFLRLGLLDNAKKHYLKALTIQPNDTQLLFNLAILATQQGATSEAVSFYTQALAIDPQFFDAHNNLAVMFLSLKKPELALKHFQAALQIQPNNKAIQHSIRLLQNQDNIDASPPEYIQSLFDSYAQHYDAHLTQTLHYQLPQKIMELVNKHLPEFHFDILDLGCGTGLCAELFKNKAKSMTGVDLSGNMLAIAKEKNIYTQLIQADLLTFLKEHKDAYDFIIAGDVFVYFGDLHPLFSAIYHALRVKGYLIFNTEMTTQHQFAATSSGRFVHAKSYLQDLMDAFSFKLVDYEQIPIRLQDQTSVYSHLYLIKK